MSILYYMALLATAIGLFLCTIYIVTNVGNSKPKITFLEAIILFLGILLSAWGIDTLTHLDQF